MPGGTWFFGRCIVTPRIALRAVFEYSQQREINSHSHASYSLEVPHDLIGAVARFFASHFGLKSC